MHTQLYPIIDSKGQFLPVDEPIHIHIPRPGRQEVRSLLRSQLPLDADARTAAAVQREVLEAA